MSKYHTQINTHSSIFFRHYLNKKINFRYVKEYNEFLRQNNVKEMLEKYEDVMEYLSRYTGKRVDTTSAVYYLYNLFKEQVPFFFYLLE